MNPGRLVALEGLDGCGKTTQLPRLAAALRAEGWDPLTTREPTDGPYGRRIREMALAERLVAPLEELRWFVEDRRQHVAATIRPGLAAGYLVLTDRYTLSTVAYQGARGLDWRELLAAGEAEFPVPDVVLLFDLDPALGLERVRVRGGRLEHAFESLDFLERAAEIFRAVDRDYVERIDASGSPERVCEEALARVRARLGAPRRRP